MTMRRVAVILSTVGVLAALTTAPVAAHNAGCVQTGNGDYVFVGSNKESPAVPATNPNSSFDPREHRMGVFLDLQPESPGSDQYGARFAADQGNSAVDRPVTSPTDPRDCQPPGPRADNSP